MNGPAARPARAEPVAAPPVILRRNSAAPPKPIGPSTRSGRAVVLANWGNAGPYHTFTRASGATRPLSPRRRARRSAIRAQPPPDAREIVEPFAPLSSPARNLMERGRLEQPVNGVVRILDRLDCDVRVKVLIAQRKQPAGGRPPLAA